MSDLYKRVSARLELEWYPLHRDEWFSQEDVYKHFNWKEAETRHALSQKLYHDYKEKNPPMIEKNNRLYRLIDTIVEEIDWQSADEKAVVDLILPFDLHKYVKIFPKSIIVVAGTSNAGKTAFLYNLILLNIYNKGGGEGGLPIVLYNNETSAEQMKERFMNFGRELPKPPPFKTIERYDNFADVLNPDGLSVIDYIDSDTEVYNNGLELSRIFRKLRRGVCVAALQKKFNRKNFKGQIEREDLGYGGNPTLKRASLYVSMNPGSLKIIKAKSWKQPNVNPNGIMWTFKLINGAEFIQIERDYESEE